MRVLITRPLEESESLASALQARGIDCVVEPLLEIKPIETPAPSLEGIQALLFTSANGVRAFAALETRRDLPVYAIGERTAQVAREVGFATVASANGAVGELASLVRASLDSKEGALLHGAGAEVKGDLAALLAPDGFDVRRTVLYEAVPAAALSGATVTALRDGSLDAVLLFSPRSAETFVGLVRRAGVEAACARLAALCLSPAVADAAKTVAWRDVRIASRPEQSALLELLALQDPSLGEARTVTEASDKPETAAETATESQALRAIRAFGGIRPMAAKVGVPVTTVQGWKERGTIPEPRIPDVLAAAAKHGVALSDVGLKATSNDKSGAGGEELTVTAQAAVSQPTPDERPSLAQSPPSKDKEQAKEPGVGRSSRPSGSVTVAIALWALVLAACVLAGALSLSYWAPLVGLEPAEGVAMAPPPQIEALQGRLAALEGRLKSAGSESAAGAGPELAARTAQLADDLAAVQRRIGALERALGDLASRPEPKPGVDPEKLAALSDQAVALGQRVAGLEAAMKKIGEASAQRAAFILAVGQLRDALARAAPYDKALASVAALAEGDAALDAPLGKLRAHAASGIATRADLTARFEAVSLAAARAAMEPEQPGWVGEALARLSHLFVIRRINGDVAGDRADAVLARAGARLDRGDLAGAVAELAALQGRSADAVAPWLAEAQARLAADQALETIGARAIARLDESRS